MTEFMRQRHHVARLALIVEQHIGMRARHRRMREGAARLAGAHRRVDPALLEKPLGDRRHLRREAAIGLKHRVAGLRPRNCRVVGLRQRRVAVPVFEFFETEPLCLHRIVAVRKRRIGTLHGVGQRRNDFGLDAIGDVSRLRDVGEAA